MELPVESIVEGRCNGMGIGENGQVESGRIVFVVEGLDVVVRIGPETEPRRAVSSSVTCSISRMMVLSVDERNFDTMRLPYPPLRRAGFTARCSM